MLSAEYWIIPIAIFGSMIGSFLNVVIFRLPRDLSLSNPRWSFCPNCHNRVRPQHNVPILGWLWLRGRCKDCAAPIPINYPLIECITALCFVTAWDALFIARVMPGVGVLKSDWPVALAVLMLFAVLLAISAMDIEYYCIDIRICYAAMFVGVVCHGIWAAPSTTPLAGMPTSLALVGVAMGAIGLLTAVVMSRFDRAFTSEANDGANAAQPDDKLGAASSDATADLSSPPSASNPAPPWGIILLSAVIVGLIVWQSLTPTFHFGGPTVSAGVQRGIVACFVLMALLVLASRVHRVSDEQIVEEIEAERHQSRRMVLLELSRLLPAIVAGIAVFAYLRMTHRLDASGASLLGMTNPGPAWLPYIEGACRSIAALIFSAALGWAVRILGTLAFGKEAFGSGDIYIMAAIGAVLGFWAVIFTFFLAAVLALIGVVASMFFKSTRAIPFGPWLALGAFVTLWLYGSLLPMFSPTIGRLLWSILSGHPFEDAGI